MDCVRTPDAVSAVLATSGPAAALAYLNEGVPHRFSAIYRFAGPILHNVFLHDKAGRMRPDFLADAIRWYVEHPDDRAGIGTAAEHDRLIAALSTPQLVAG